MTEVSASEANQYFSRLLRAARSGRSVVITQRGKPVAKLIPYAGDRGAELERQARLVREGRDRLAKRPIIVAGPWTREDLYD